MPYPFANNPLETFMLTLRSIRGEQRDCRTVFDATARDGSTLYHAARAALLEANDRLAQHYKTQPEPRDYDVYMSPFELRMQEFDTLNPRPQHPGLSCVHSNVDARMRTVRGGATHLHWQCVDCGSLRGSLLKADFPGKQFPPFDEVLLDAGSRLETAWHAKRQAFKAAELGEAWLPFDYAAFTATYEEERPRPFDPYSCAHATTVMTRRQFAGSQAVVLQCDRCGKHVRSVRKDAAPALSTLRPFDEQLTAVVETAANDWSHDKHTASRLAEEQYLDDRARRIAAGEIREIDTSRFATYYSTPEWQRTRLRIFERDDHICQRCEEAATDAHHITYDRLGCENDLDLIALCSSCHANVHEHQDRGEPGLRLTPTEIRSLSFD